MKKAIFLDRDGTINVEKDYLYKIEDFEFEKKAIDGLKMLKEMGYLLIVITNQSGVARGKYSETQIEELHNYIIDKTEQLGCKIDKIYYCPHHPEGLGVYKKICDCRKPGIALIQQAIKEFDIDIKKSFMVGDKMSDLQAGINAGLEPALVLTGYGKQTFNELKNLENPIKVENYDDLLNFALVRQMFSSFEDEYNKED